MKIIKNIILALAVFFICIPAAAGAVSVSGSWNINDFQSEIQVNRDSSVLITENITADCPSCVNKHGIFRVLPEKIKLDNGKTLSTPVHLESITDFNNNPISYSQSRDRLAGTITWKIGDANREVMGVNYYRIKYSVDNAVRTYNSDFDEFYWNVVGNFWDIDIDKFGSTINFPGEVNKDNAKISYYTGTIGSKDTNLAKVNWASGNALKISSTSTLNPGQGITISVSVPKGIFIPYEPGFWTKFGAYFSLIIPIIILIASILIWSRFGRDPKGKTTIVPEFEIPGKLSPMEMGLVYTDGALEPKFIAAEIINLAVLGAIKIEKIDKKWFLGGDDYKLTRLKEIKLSVTQTTLLEHLFEGKKEIELSSLRNSFSYEIAGIAGVAKESLEGKKLLLGRSRAVFIAYIVLAVMALAGSFFLFVFGAIWTISLIISAIILFIFAPLMKVRTVEGTEMLGRIKGFKLYMETAEKYRQRFNEKENIFERFLPYAIMFGITKLWIKKIKQLYGEKYFNTYVPIWIIGVDVEKFSSEGINSVVAGVSSAVSSSTGAGGGGFSGGGSGGGGGGGW